MIRLLDVDGRRLHRRPIIKGVNMINEIEKPEKLKNEHLEYLDDLQESDVTNMYGATPYLQDSFSELSKEDARSILSYWMKTFSSRHNGG